MATAKAEKYAHPSCSFVTSRSTDRLPRPESRRLRGRTASTRKMPRSLRARKQSLILEKEGTFDTPFFTCTHYEKRH